MSVNHQEEKRAYTVNDIAAQFGCCRNKVYDALNSGELESIKIGRCRRITINQRDRWLRKLEEAGRSA